MYCTYLSTNKNKHFKINYKRDCFFEKSESLCSPKWRRCFFVPRKKYPKVFTNYSMSKSQETDEKFQAMFQPQNAKTQMLMTQIHAIMMPIYNIYTKTCAVTSHDVLIRPWFLPLIVFSNNLVFWYVLSHPWTFNIISNFDSGCSWLKIIEYNLRSIFFPRTPCRSMPQ